MTGLCSKLVDIADVFEIVPYYAYRYYGTYPFNCHKLVVFGRVQEDVEKNPLSAETLKEIGDINDQIKTLLHEANPKENVKVRISVEGMEDEILTTNDGFYFRIFHVDEDFPYNVSEGTVSIEESSLEKFQKHDKISTKFKIFNINANECNFAVISNIDETILQSEDSERLKLIYQTLFATSESCKPISGAKELFNDLYLNGKNPFFYISKNPAALCPSVKQFIEEKGYPNGPVLVQNLDLKALNEPSTKNRTIDGIIGAYPGLKFILIGCTDDLQVYSVSIFMTN